MKKTLIVIGSILLAVCLLLNFWYLYILFFAKEKLIVNTFNVGLLTNADGTENRNFIELNYYSNKNKNGLETFEIKFNYFYDEEQKAFFSQGLQIVADDGKNINFQYFKDIKTRSDKKYKSKSSWPSYYDYYSVWGSFLNVNSEKFNYMSSDNFDNTLISTNPLNSNSEFKIELDNVSYILKFKNEIFEKDKNGNYTDMPLPDLFYSSEMVDFNYWLVGGTFIYDDNYLRQDLNYFVKILFESIKDLKSGSNIIANFEFSDLFKYYKLVDGQYVEISTAETTKIVSVVKNYYSIKVNKYDDGLQKASQSLFNCVKGNSTFNISGDYSLTEYFTGLGNINVNISNFDLIKQNNGTYNLKLNDSFINKYTPYKNKIGISVDLNLDELLKNSNIRINLPTSDTYCGFKVIEENIVGSVFVNSNVGGVI